MTYEELFSDVPVGTSVWRRWEAAPAAVLDAAAEKIAAHKADPWVFAADARHFWQFAGNAERAAFHALTEEEHLALLGPWEDEDFDPESFG